MRRLFYVSCVLLPGMIVAAVALFPGQRLSMAFTILTGIGKDRLQADIDALEAKAIARNHFSQAERDFLTDFYRTLATGARLSIYVGQTGRLMDHYLDATGSDYELHPSIFTKNEKVQKQKQSLRESNAARQCKSGRLVSPVFYMPDASEIDSVFGLYYGRLHLKLQRATGDRCLLQWRAEVPWQWPSYDQLKRKYGTYHAESFPLPNLISLTTGADHALYVDNGLGEYLVQLRLARSFLAFAQWEEFE